MNTLRLSLSRRKLPRHSKGLRVAPTDNYLVLYLPDEETGTVHIVRIIYGGRDLTRQLLKTEV